MKASKLMVGDIVFYEYDCQKFTAKVLEVYRNSVLVEEIHGDYEPIEIVENKIFPVEITPEILEKNGWKCTSAKDEMKINGETFEIWIDFNEKRHWVNIIAHAPIRSENYLSYYEGYIEAVHELQHALRLCGLSKLADNFKV